MPFPMAMNVGAQSLTKVPKRSPDALASPLSVPPWVNQMTMLPMTDRNPSAYERFAPKHNDFGFVNISTPYGTVDLDNLHGELFRTDRAMFGMLCNEPIGAADSLTPNSAPNFAPPRHHGSRDGAMAF